MVLAPKNLNEKHDCTPLYTTEQPGIDQVRLVEKLERKEGEGIIRIISQNLSRESRVEWALPRKMDDKNNKHADTHIIKEVANLLFIDYHNNSILFSIINFMNIFF